jgi:predicted transcriptional regulator YdeE
MEGLFMDVKVVTRAFSCVGTKHSCTREEKGIEIPKAHKAFLYRLGEMRNRTGNGIMLYNPGPIDSNIESWGVCAEVSEIQNIPDGMSSFILPSREYAYCCYIGEIYGIGESYSKLHLWILEHGDYDDGAIIEVTDERFQVTLADSEVQIYVPFKRKR